MRGSTCRNLERVTGIAGVGLTTTVVVEGGAEQPLTVTVAVYEPACALVTAPITGLRRFEVKPFGPVHEYVAPLTALASS
jgi:hypothetical protein